MAAIDRLIGADRLKPVQRAELRADQIRSIVSQTPLMVAGNAFVGLAMCAIAFANGSGTFFVVWFAALAMLMLVAMQSWRKSRDKTFRTASEHAVKRAAAHAFLLGTLWGMMPPMLLPGASNDTQIIVEISVAGVLFGSVFALVNLPHAAFALALPVLVGSFATLPFLDTPMQTLSLGALLAGFVVLIGSSCINVARRFVRHFDTEARIRDQNNIISLFLKEFEENSSDWLWEFDANGQIERVSDRFAGAAGLSREALLGRDFRDFIRTVCVDPKAADEITRSIEEKQTIREFEFRLQTAQGERWWRISGKPLFDAFHAYSGYVGTASDISAEKAAESQINYLAHNDPLTGLMNRARFTEQLKQCVARLERYGAPFTVFYLDLDQFKLVNDTRGHLVGDKLLIEVARRIRAVVRETDSVARLGGDEFAIILPNSANTHESAVLASRIVESLHRQYSIEGEICTVGVSIGIAVAPINGTRPDQLLRNADLALYRAKEDGKGVFRFFENQMDSSVRERRTLELELQEAIQEGQLVLHYQPLVASEDAAPSGFEALVRWNHPIRGMVSPAEFIPIAEQSSLICDIGDWTIREACRAASNWPGNLFVAVNMSAKHFQRSDIPAVVAAALAESGLSPDKLELEITESLLIERPDEVVSKLAKVQALGVTIALDDFGTGYSSLSYLMKFPFNKIKIDKSFVTASSGDTVARDILRTISALGESLNIHITAEGVETQEQVDFLREIACHQLQGFFFAKPLNEADLSAYLLRFFASGLADRSSELDGARRLPLAVNSR